MIINLKHEIIVFWSSFFCAQAIGIFFDFFRCLRKRYPHGNFSVAVEDVLFCTLSFKLFFDVCNICNNGGLRWYIFAALILSGILYFCTLSSYMMKCWNLIFNIVLYLTYPVRKCVTLLFSLITLIWGKYVSAWNKISYFATKKLPKRNK